jgi:O-antigen ligase
MTHRAVVLILLLMAASAFLFLSTASTAYSSYGIWKSQGFLLFILMPCTVILVNFNGNPTAQMLFFKTLLVLTAIPLLLPLIVGQKVETWSMRWLLGSLGYNIIGISRSLGIGSILAFTLAINSRLRVAIPLMALFLVLFYGQVTLGERGPMLALAVSLILVALMRPVVRPSSFRRHLIKLTCLIVIVVVVISATGYVMMLRASVEHQELRVEILKESWGDFIESPLFGIGLGNFIYDSGTFGKRQYAHNFILEIMVELGLVGLIVLGLFFVVAWAWRTRHCNLSAEYRLLADISLGLLIFSVVAAMFSGDIPTNNMVWVSQALLFTTWRSGRITRIA